MMVRDTRAAKRLDNSIMWDKAFLNEWIAEALAIAKSKGMDGRCYPASYGTSYLEVLLNSVDMRKIMEWVEHEYVENLRDAIHAGKPFKMSFKEYKARVLELAVDPEWWRE